MTKDRKKASAGGKTADEDDQIWQHTVQTVEPLKRAKSRVHASSETAPKVVPRAVKETGSRKGETVAKPVLRPVEQLRPQKTPPLADFDRKAARKIRRGNHEIEARLDLHGMRQERAHAALCTFIERCVASRKRWVLVITGKGKPSATSDGTLDYHDRGILRRNVPRWLEEPQLRVHVVSFTQAAISHGGEGALYVHLRTREPR